MLLSFLFVIVVVFALNTQSKGSRKTMKQKLYPFLVVIEKLQSFKITYLKSRPIPIMLCAQCIEALI